MRTILGNLNKWETVICVACKSVYGELRRQKPECYANFALQSRLESSVPRKQGSVTAKQTEKPSLL